MLDIVIYIVTYTMYIHVLNFRNKKLSQNAKTFCESMCASNKSAKQKILSCFPQFFREFVDKGEKFNEQEYKGRGQQTLGNDLDDNFIICFPPVNTACK